jgi:hypothetical protein
MSQVWVDYLRVHELADELVCNLNIRIDWMVQEVTCQTASLKA